MEVTVELGPEIEMGVSLLQKRAEGGRGEEETAQTERASKKRNIWEGEASPSVTLISCPNSDSTSSPSRRCTLVCFLPPHRMRDTGQWIKN